MGNKSQPPQIDLLPSSPPKLLAPLREFEVSIIARFLSCKDKLTVAARLNSSWRALTTKSYAWTRLPSFSPDCLVSDFVNFFDCFPSVSCLHVPFFPGDFLSPHRVSSL